MRRFKLTMLAAIAVPAIALAQSGPNPAVKNGSLDPTVGPTNDPVTAPDDVVRPGGPEGDQLPAPAAPSGSDAATTNTTGAVTTGDSSGDAASETKRTTAPTSESKRKPR